MAAWKSLERRVARALGGERAGPLGKHGSDVVGEDVIFAVEIKRRAKYCLSAKMLDQARRQSQDEGKPWLIVQAEHGTQFPIAILDFGTLLELIERKPECAFCGEPVSR